LQGRSFSDEVKLLAVNGVPIGELAARVARATPVENPHHANAWLRRALVSDELLPKLIPGWEPGTAVRLELESPAGARASKTIPAATRQPVAQGSWTTPPKRWARLSRSDEPFSFQFLDPEGIAYFRVSTLMGREAYELALRYGWGDPVKMMERHYARKNVPMPSDPEAALRGIPSFLEKAEDLLRQMRQRGTKHLVVDLRGNGGGVTPMVYPFLYEMYGDGYFGHEFRSEFVTVQSSLFLQKQNMTVEAWRQKTGDPGFEPGEYSFRDEPVESPRSRRDKQIAEYRGKGMSFAARLEALQGAAIYTPAQVVMLCDGDTYSAAFHFLYYLRELGAKVVGVPPGQAPNTFMEKTPFTLPESGLRGSISNSAQIFLPESPSAQVLLPDHPVTYEMLKAYDFDEETALRYALDNVIGAKTTKPGKRP
jgi:hypothetical protein